MSANRALFDRLKRQKREDLPFLATIFDEITKATKNNQSWVVMTADLRGAFGVYGDWLAETGRTKAADMYWAMRDYEEKDAPSLFCYVRSPSGVHRAVRSWWQSNNWLQKWWRKHLDEQSETCS